MRILTALLVLSIGIIALVCADRLPPQHSPFMRLDPERPIGFATARQLSTLRDDPEACRAALARSRMQTKPLSDRREGPFCALQDAVLIQRSVLRYATPMTASCPLALALYIWEREVVAPAALRHLNASIVGIDHYGTYACRRVAGGVTGRPSQHATANAIDVAGFRLADGRRLSIAAGWEGDSRTQAFLRAVRDGSCRLFRSVLGPEYNAAHRDHFHLDMGPFRGCR